MINYYVDFENVHYKGLSGIEMLDKNSKIYIYCRRTDEISIRKFLNRFEKLKAKIELRFIIEHSKNALDFVLISDLAREYKKGNISYVVSNDKGYDAALSHLRSERLFTDRCITIEKRSLKFLLGS